MVGYLPNVREIAAALNGILDPWQVAPDFRPWAPAPRPKGQIANLSIRRPQRFFSSCSSAFPPGSGSGFTTSGGLENGGGSVPCFVSAPSYTTVFVPVSNCPRLQYAARNRRVSSAVAHPARADAIDSEIQAHSISDSQIDENIDKTIPATARAYVAAIMKTLPPDARQHVSGIDEAGHFFSNRQAEYDAVAQSGRWEQIQGSVWRNPSGEEVTLPNLPREAASMARHTESAGSPPCPAPGSTDTGGYVRGYICNSPSRTFRTTVNATAVGGPPGQSWCIQGLNRDTGYLLFGDFSASSSGGAAEGGLQWSPTNEWYAMYAKDGLNGPDNLPWTYNFLPGVFTMTFTTNANLTWSETVASARGTYTWVHAVTSNAATGSAWTYKQGTTIAQNAVVSTTGSYFGVDAVGAPLFSWSSAPSHDYFPDSTRGIRVNETYGVYLHP